MQGVQRRPVRALDPMELKRTDPLRLLIQAYSFFSSGRAACEAAAAPAGAFVTGVDTTFTVSASASLTVNPASLPNGDVNAPGAPGVRDQPHPAPG